VCFGVRWAWSEVAEVVEGAQIAAAGGLRYLMTAHLSEFLADEGGRQAEGREHAGGGLGHPGNDARAWCERNGQGEPGRFVDEERDLGAPRTAR